MTPIPRTKYTAAGTFQPTDGPAGAAATPPKLRRVSAPPPSPRANRGRGRNCIGGILALLPNLRDPKLKRPRDTVGGQMPTSAFAPPTQRKLHLRRPRPCAGLWVRWACAAPVPHSRLYMKLMYAFVKKIRTGRTKRKIS